MKFFLKKVLKKIADIKKSSTFATALTEKQCLNKPNWSVRLGVRTQGFHPCNRGSIPLRTTKLNALFVSKRYNFKIKLVKENGKP